MEEILRYLDKVIDMRQHKKVKHKMGDIIGIVFFAMLTRVETWHDIWCFAVACETVLRKYFELPNGIPSHDTIERVFAMVNPVFLQKFQAKWNEMLSTNEGEKIKKLLALDGKTQCGNGNKNQKANHIVTAVTEDGISVGEKLVSEKSNEITAIPELLKMLNIKDNIVTIDAMGTQIEIARQIRKQRADYLLALKLNQTSLYQDVADYFNDDELLKRCAYTKTIEKARGGLETREYWQTEDISWLHGRSKWAGLKSVGMARNTISKGGRVTVETRYFISSLGTGVKEFARAVRGHWMIESFHWHLDVTFREDANRTLEKQAAFNLNIMRKLALSILKLLDVHGKKLSLRTKRYAVGLNPQRYFEQLFAM
jgi:predicted transposase YbfD/YdcC